MQSWSPAYSERGVIIYSSFFRFAIKTWLIMKRIHKKKEMVKDEETINTKRER